MARPKTASTVVDLDLEDSIGMAGTQGKVVPAQSKRKTGQGRPSYEDAAHCPHCAGRMHMNLPVSTVNFECLWRQYALSKGLIQHPGERLPIFSATDLTEMAEWAETRGRSRKSPLAYGKMASATGAASTYAGMKQTKSAKDLTEEIEVPKRRGRPPKVVEEAPVKPKVGRPPKAAAVSVAPPRNKQITEEDLDFGDIQEAPVRNGKAKLKTGRTKTPVVAAPESTGKRPKVKVRSGAQPTADAKSVKAPSPKPAKNAERRGKVLARSRG